MSGGYRKFFCLCSPKDVDTLESCHLKQNQKDEELRQHLDQVELGTSGKLVLCLPGGGVASEGLGVDPEVAVEGPYLAVITGSLTNYAYLIRKYFVEDLGYPRNVSLESIRQSSPIRDAALLCKLYEKLGTGMLPKLRGPFCFCLYDSSMRRMLTARDPTCGCELVQGETKEGALFVSAGGFEPEGCSKVRTILPGEFKYGWRSEPRKYANAQDDVDTSAAAAASAARAALSGIKLNGKVAQRSKHSSPEAVSKVPVVPEGPQLKTKKEIRAWSAMMAQEALKTYESEWLSRAFSNRNCGTDTKHEGSISFSSWRKSTKQDIGFVPDVREWKPAGQSSVSGQKENSLAAQFQPQVLATLLGSSEPSGSPSSKISKHERVGNFSSSDTSGANSSHRNTSCDSSMTTSESSSSLSTEVAEKVPLAIQFASDDKQASSCTSYGD